MGISSMLSCWQVFGLADTGGAFVGAEPIYWPSLPNLAASILNSMGCSRTRSVLLMAVVSTYRCGGSPDFAPAFPLFEALSVQSQPATWPSISCKQRLSTTTYRFHEFAE